MRLSLCYSPLNHIWDDQRTLFNMLSEWLTRKAKKLFSMHPGAAIVLDANYQKHNGFFEMHNAAVSVSTAAELIGS